LSRQLDLIAADPGVFDSYPSSIGMNIAEQKIPVAEVINSGSQPVAI
jgi:hypothetical protein